MRALVCACVHARALASTWCATPHGPVVASHGRSCTGRRRRPRITRRRNPARPPKHLPIAGQWFRFTAVLGNMSTSNKQRRLLADLSANLAASGHVQAGRGAVRMMYVPALKVGGGVGCR